MYFNCMCLTITGEVVELKERDAVVEVEGRKTHVKVNPSISVKEGDRVIIFKNFILDKANK